MAIVLDTVTKASYDALTLASGRASAVVAALTGAVVVEVYDGLDVLRASGTMASPWATASGATITVGEVTGAGLLVATGGAPDANWYCQFRSGTRFVRGTFGVAGEGRDFTWSLSSFQAGSRGTLGTVTLLALGTVDSGLVSILAAPLIYVYPQDSGLTTLDNGVTPRPESITATPAVGSTVICHFGNYTRDLLDPVSADNYNYPLIRSFQWYRNGVAITGQNTQCYALVNADAGQSITCRETVYEPRGSVAAAFSAFPLPPTATYTFETAAVVPTGTRSATLVYHDDIEYLGSFLPPNDSDIATYSGYGLAWNAAGNGGAGSLLMFGKQTGVGAFKTVEMALPAIAPRTSFDACPRATVLQTARDARESWTASVELTGDIAMAGQLVYGGRLIQSVTSIYTTSSSPRSHASRPLNLATTGDVKWAKVVDTSRGLTLGRTFGGQMCHVPAAWQAALGGPALTGATSLSVVASGSSDGPCSGAFDPAAINNGELEAETLTRYTGGEFNNDGSDTANGAGGHFGIPHPLWYQGVMAISTLAMVIPFGTDSMLIVGERGEGTYQYSPTDQFNNGIGIVPAGAVTVRGVFPTFMRTYDPDYYTAGPHAYPYTTGIYAFRLSDLAAVKAGTKQPGQVRPYGVWGIRFPFGASSQSSRVMSGCYDPAGRRMFIVQFAASGGGQIAIHAYRINNAVAA